MWLCPLPVCWAEMGTRGTGGWGAAVCPRHGQPPSSGFRASAQCFSFLLLNPQSTSLPLCHGVRLTTRNAPLLLLCSLSPGALGHPVPQAWHSSCLSQGRRDPAALLPLSATWVSPGDSRLCPVHHGSDELSEEGREHRAVLPHPQPEICDHLWRGGGSQGD